ncbi:TIGR03987 family protein [Naumannella sp. ID2617S]|uniref:TIGR03987 family protein n=1 Tax=Enemella dayhoffiae TaxID=2016507 RepID=A0A255HBD1_9ACTN|nr:HsmA family protein [Enemella dayhoffiae]NNG20091.1 TIGR03987 family protein [Naumannella sp. ID2617S]OYO25298.1 TIGR03987 family protein [Enemella dayhoffiae]
MLIAAIVLITAALIFYTTGVWAEHRAGTLRRWHVGAFAAGLACDAAGTALMSGLADLSTGTPGLLTRIMMITGGVALLLMVGHLAWAVVVLLRDRASERARFHRLSVVVWGIWLIPYFTGMAGSMIN